MSLTSDTMMTMPVVPAGSSGYGGGGNGLFGNDGALWLIVLFLFIFAGGWGRGFGGGSDGGSGGYSADIQRSFDNSAVVTKLDGITQGICDSTYALNNAITNGFNNTNMGMMQGFNGVERSMCNLSSQIASCCCDTQRSIDGVNFNMANNTRDIIDNQNSNTRAILDYLCKDKIDTLQAENQSLRLAASQANQNAVLQAAMDANTAEILRRTAPLPVPSYTVANPYTGVYGGCGCGTGCGC